MTHDAIPTFKTLEEECDFWGEHSITEFKLQEVDMAEIWDESEQATTRVFPVVVQFDAPTFIKLKAVASSRHVDCATLVKEFTRSELDALVSESM